MHKLSKYRLTTLKLLDAIKVFPSPKGYGEGRGDHVEPNNKDRKLPVVLVIHENRGFESLY